MSFDDYAAQGKADAERRAADAHDVSVQPVQTTTRTASSSTAASDTPQQHGADALCDEDGTHGVALFFCPTCSANYCLACDTDAHDGVGTSTHERIEYVIRVVSCDGVKNCPHPATVVCADAGGKVMCGNLCAACDTEKHAKGVKAKHPPRKPLSRRVCF